MKNTTLLLMAEHGEADIKLESISEKYFGLAPEQAKRKASSGKLPVTAYRAASSQKAPWLVRVSDLADYLDQCRAEAELAVRGHGGVTGRQGKHGKSIP